MRAAVGGVRSVCALRCRVCVCGVAKTYSLPQSDAQRSAATCRRAGQWRVGRQCSGVRLLASGLPAHTCPCHSLFTAMFPTFLCLFFFNNCGKIHTTKLATAVYPSVSTMLLILKNRAILSFRASLPVLPSLQPLVPSTLLSTCVIVTPLGASWKWIPAVFVTGSLH